MPPLELAGLTIFILLLFTGIYAAIIGLPGTVLILGDAFFYALATGFDKIGLKAIALLAMMALAAEAVGATMEMTGKLRLTPSWKGFVASLAGGITGDLWVRPLLLGLATLLGIFLGGFAGFFLQELFRQSRIKPALRASSGAILTSAAGIFTKGSLALTMTVVTLNYIYS